MEALAAAVLLGIGVTAVSSGIGAMLKAEARSREHEYRERLAVDKLNEFLALGNFDSPTVSGDFSDRNAPTYHWTADVTPSGIDNLSDVVVTVSVDAQDNTQNITAETLVFRPAQNTTTGGTTP